jgi:hypothetical protein
MLISVYFYVKLCTNVVTEKHLCNIYYHLPWPNCWILGTH